MASQERRVPRWICRSGRDACVKSRVVRFFAVVVILLAAACDREARQLAVAAVGERRVAVNVSTSSLRAGGGEAPPPSDLARPMYEGVAYQISEGQRYYEWFNCSGCHAHGGGDVGPALMDDEWRYGGAITQIRASIADGRPNGMPAFGGMIPDEQLWQIAAYVRSMSGSADKLAASSRDDHMRTTPPTTRPSPVPNTATPPPRVSGRRGEASLAAHVAAAGGLRRRAIDAGSGRRPGGTHRNAVAADAVGVRVHVPAGPRLPGGRDLEGAPSSGWSPAWLKGSKASTSGRCCGR
jgi:cytochrome c oxidase cbb3-type subunit 3